jgi:mannosyl-oligosaccharide alpha-1,2-mannosidase
VQTSSVGNWTYIADSPQPGELRLVGSHLECFHAGNWIMGGKMLNNQTIVDIALKLADSCWNTYVYWSFSWNQLSDFG